MIDVHITTTHVSTKFRSLFRTPVCTMEVDTPENFIAILRCSCPGCDLVLQIQDLRDHFVHCARDKATNRPQPTLDRLTPEQKVDKRNDILTTGVDKQDVYSVLENRLNDLEERVATLTKTPGTNSSNRYNTRSLPGNTIDFSVPVPAEAPLHQHDASVPNVKGSIDAKQGLPDNRGTEHIHEPFTPRFYTVRLVKVYSESGETAWRTPMISIGDFGFHFAAVDTNLDLGFAPMFIGGALARQGTLPRYSIAVVQHGNSDERRLNTSDLSLGQYWNMKGFFKDRNRTGVILDVFVNKECSF